MDTRKQFTDLFLDARRILPLESKEDDLRCRKLAILLSSLYIRYEKLLQEMDGLQDGPMINAAQAELESIICDYRGVRTALEQILRRAKPRPRIDSGDGGSADEICLEIARARLDLLEDMIILSAEAQRSGETALQTARALQNDADIRQLPRLQADMRRFFNDAYAASMIINTMIESAWFPDSPAALRPFMQGPLSIITCGGAPEKIRELAFALEALLRRIGEYIVSLEAERADNQAREAQLLENLRNRSAED